LQYELLLRGASCAHITAQGTVLLERAERLLTDARVAAVAVPVVGHLAETEQSACVLVENGPSCVRIDLWVVKVSDCAQKRFSTFVRKIGSEDEPIRPE
jgi:hypothetical protein